MKNINKAILFLILNFKNSENFVGDLQIFHNGVIYFNIFEDKN